MKKIILAFFLGGSALSIASAQSIERSVIGSAGGTSSAGSTILTWTVGETVIHTATAGSVILTQGFQQPEATNVSVEPIKLQAGLHVYPNPSGGLFTIAANTNASMDLDILSIEVRDGAGKLVHRNASFDISSGTNSLDLTNLPGGFYSLSIGNQGMASATYKLTIIK